jgi:phage baseplate assembly protein gpV
MSIDRLINTMKGFAAAQSGAVGQPRRGTVIGYNPATNTAKVMLEPEGVETGWLPIESAGATANGGLQFGPTIGAQCKVTPADGDTDSGTVSGFMHSDADAAPGAPSGECWIVQPGTGSFIKLMANGHILAQDASGAFVLLSNNGQATIQDASGTSLVLQDNGNALLTGNLIVTGDITDRNRTGATATLAEFRAAYDAHGHPYNAGSTPSVTGTTNDPV